MKKKNYPAAPPAWLYGLAVFTIGLYLRLRYHIRIDRKQIKSIKGPLIGIANHQSNYDFIVTAMTMWPLRMNYLASSYYFNSKPLGRLLRYMGVIPKTQFVPDSAAVLSAYRAVLRNQSIMLFPEGQVEYFGADVTIDRSTAKLIKRFRVPVVNIKLRGGFLSSPKWSKKEYPARRESICELLLTKEQIAAMTEEEIYDAVLKGISYNEYDWQRETMIPSKGIRYTDGLQNILYRCPECNKDCVTLPDKDLLRCSSCGYTVRMNRYGFFEAVSTGGGVIYDNPAGWFRMQQRELEKELPDILPFSTPCNLMSTGKKSLGYYMRGKGVLTVNEEGLIFEGTRDSEPFIGKFSIKTQSGITHDARVWGIDFIGDDCNYAFCPEDPRNMIKIVEIYRILRENCMAEYGLREE